MIDQFAGIMRSGAIAGRAVGLSLAVVMPPVAGSLAPMLRRLIGNTLKDGIVAYERAAETANGLAEVLYNMVAEVPAELHQKKHRQLAGEAQADVIETERAVAGVVVKRASKN